MRVAVLSGKGGAGKTLISVNLAAVAGRSTYIDCDVEEPNGRLFLKPEEVERTPVHTLVPQLDGALCTGCRACVDFCRFHALAFVKKRPLLFPDVCHACGGCALVCPAHAITEAQRPVGVLEEGRRGEVRVITGILDPGEASGVGVIRAALEAGAHSGDPVIIDCPPGSACPVMESLSEADRCILVAEPTAFGLHNLRMVHELTALLGKPCGVVINKETEPYGPLEDFCHAAGLPILMRLPYRADLARRVNRGELISQTDPDIRARFSRLLREIGGLTA